MKTQKAVSQKEKVSKATFTSGSIPKAMLIFVGPYMLGILLQNLYGAVDLFVVGHYAQTADVSAVTIGSQLMSIVTQLIIGLATGITMLIGQYFGAKNEKELSRTVGSSVTFFAVAGIILTAIYLGLHSLFVNAMQTPTEALAATKEYLLVCALGIPFIVGYNVITSILTGLGDSKTPFIFIAVACVVNIVLDITLVKFIPLGALGAAIATTAAQAASFIFALVFLKRKGLGFPVKKSHIRFAPAPIKRLIKIGAPVAIQNVMVGASFLFVTAIINKIGVSASAAVGVVEKLITFIFIPAIALGTAVSTASAQNIGAQNPERAKKSLYCGIIMALVPSVIIAVLCQFFGKSASSILTNDLEVIELAANYLKSYVWDVVIVAFVFCMNGYFNSQGKSWFSLLHSLATTFAVRTPLAYLFSTAKNTSLFLIGWAAPISTLVSLIMCVIFLIYQNKKPDVRLPA